MQGRERAIDVWTAVEAVVRSAVTTGDVPGIVATVGTASGTCLEVAFGERGLEQGLSMESQTVCWMASMTKPLVGAAAMQLVEQGRLKLDAPAAAVIASLGQVQILGGWDAHGQPVLRATPTPVTLRHLLTHTSGFAYDTWNADIARLARLTGLPRAASGQLKALDVPLVFEPGTRWEYGIGIDWVGRMIETVTGMRLGEYLRENLFAPLGMDATAFRIAPDMRARLARVHARDANQALSVVDFEIAQDPEFEPGGSGLYSTAPDYLRFLRMLLNNGAIDGVRVLKPETVELMSQNHIGALQVGPLKSHNTSLSGDVEFFPGLPKTWGLTFMRTEGDAPTGRSAASLAWAGLANTYMWLDPKEGVAAVYLTQVLPFLDGKTFGHYLDFETAVYTALRGGGALSHAGQLDSEPGLHSDGL